MASSAHAVSTPPDAPRDDADLAAPRFGHALRGYERHAVDAYVASVDRRIAELIAEIGRLHAALARAKEAVVVLDEPAAEIVRMAAERSAALVSSIGERDAALSDAALSDAALSDAVGRAREQCEVLLTAAQVEADRMVETARRTAATIEERARQEHAWRRRQVRAEQDLVDQRKQQIMREIKTLSTLAAEAAVARSVPDETQEQVAV